MWVPGDDEGVGGVGVHDVVGREGDLDGVRAPDEEVGGGVAGVEVDLVEGCGGDGDLCARVGDGDAVGEGDEERGEGVLADGGGRVFGG